MFTFARKYRFSAAHVLRSQGLSDSDNRRLYGKCANPSGHGHDYTIEFRLSTPELEDGVVFGHGRFDQLVRERVAPQFDRADLSRTFAHGFVASGENLAVAAHRLLSPHLPSRVTLAVALVETEKNSFYYEGP